MGMNISNEGWDGSKFYGFYVGRDSVAPGWVIFGRNAEKYGRNTKTGRGNYVMLCGYVREGKWPKRNGKVRIGWRTKREAQAALDAYLADHPSMNRDE